MMRTECFLACCLLGLVADFVKGQQPYSPEPQPYVIPPGRTIDEYKRQLEDDIYAVERKAALVAQLECISGKEYFYFCSMELNLFDFIVCVINPALNPGSDAFIRGIKFPSSAFGYKPNVAVGIAGIGTIVFGDVKVVSKDVSTSGFNIVITGGIPAYPYSLTVAWIACPTSYPVSPSVRDFTPKAVPPSPPYFPINEPGQSSYGGSPTSYNENVNYEKLPAYKENQAAYKDKESKYDESSQPVDEEPSTYEGKESKYADRSQPADEEPSTYEDPTENPPPYVQKPERYEPTPNPKAKRPPSYRKTRKPVTTTPSYA